MSSPSDDALSVLAAADEVPERSAIILASEHGRRVSYAELGELVRAQCDSARAETRPVPITATSELATIVRILGCIEQHVPLALLHPRWTGAEADAVREQLAGHEDRADPLDGCLAIAYTSGTAGTPRGAVLGRDAVFASARASAKNLGWKSDDRWLLCLPLAHVGGLQVLLRCLIARSTAVLARRFDARELPRWIDRDRVTLASLVPTMLAKLLEENPRWQAPEHVRAVLLGGDQAPAALLTRSRQRGLPVLTTYGLTETCSQVTTQPPGSSSAPEWGCGVPLDGVEVRIVEDRIQVRGPMLMTSYYPRAMHPCPFLEGGWLETGDSGHIDDGGRLYVWGRWDDRIVTGGETVHPLEVEKVLEEHAGIREACVFGVTDEKWGQVVAAAIVPVGLPPSVEDLRGFAEARLAPFRRPRWIALVDELPRAASGKLNRRSKALAKLDLLPLFSIVL